MLTGPVALTDTTLRDGDQAPGVAFGAEDKVAIAQLLDGAGVAEIEVGTPIMGGEETDAVRAVASLGLRAVVSTWNRARREDLEASAACGVSAVSICVPVSEVLLERKVGRSRRWALDALLGALGWAVDRGLSVRVGGEDASRADPSFVEDLAGAAFAAGADRFRFSDTLGCLDPFAVREQIARLRRATGRPIEFHGHDDLGLATANTLAAAAGGATHLSVTALGLGERAGNAALEEVALALAVVYGESAGIDPGRLGPLCDAVASAAGRPIPAGKAVVGACAFAHESGIHADGVLKDPHTYELVPPESLGRQRHLPLGKHSGRRAVAHRLSRLGFVPDEARLRPIVAAVRRLALARKRPVDDRDLVVLWHGWEPPP